LARNSEPVIGGDLTQLPAAAASSAATRCNSSLVWRERGLRSVACSLAHQNAEATSIALYCQTVPFGPAQPADVEAVQLHLLARLGGVDVTLRRRQIGLAFVAIAMASDQDQALGTVSSPTRQSTRQTPCSLIRMPPDFSPASSALIRRGPQPGRASAKAMIRPSGCGPIWLGIGGRRRSLTLSASRPQRSTRFFRR
jgi:hypothetical protein